jgi:hypothetical protein
MPPRHRAAASLVTDPQALLGRLLLQLKLKLAGLGTDASARAQRECLRAAQEVENAVSQLEAGRPLLSAVMTMVRAAGVCLAHLTCHPLTIKSVNRPDNMEPNLSSSPVCLQESEAQATRLLDQCRQWFGNIAGTVEILGRRHLRHLPADTSWLMLRPVLRLLLWLVPEHAPEPSKAPAAARPQSDSSGSAIQGRGKHNKASTSTSEDWRCSLSLAYIKDIATVGDQGRSCDCHINDEQWALCWV